MVFCRNQVGFVLYKRRLSVNPSAHGVVLRFDMGFFGADVDKTAFSCRLRVFAGVCCRYFVLLRWLDLILSR